MEGVCGDWIVVTEVVGAQTTFCALSALPVAVLVDVAYPDRVTVMVTVAEDPAESPVTVSGSSAPETAPVTSVPAVTDGVHVYAGSTLVTVTVNPSAVRTGASNWGVRPGANGVAEIEEVAVPEPTEFTARNCTLYVVPLTKLEMTSGDAVETGDRVTQELPPFVEYW